MWTSWIARRLGNRWSVSARLTSENWGNIHGGDPAFGGPVMMNMVPTVLTDSRGGSRLDVAGGVNVFLRRMSPGQVRLGLEVSTPVYQDLDGPQLEVDYQVVSGFQVTF